MPPEPLPPSRPASRLLRELAEADPLIGLHNRRSFMEKAADDARRLGSDRRAAGTA